MADVSQEAREAAARLLGWRSYDEGLRHKSPGLAACAERFAQFERDIRARADQPSTMDAESVANRGKSLPGNEI